MKAYFLTCILLININLLVGQTIQNFKLSKPQVVNIANPICIDSNKYFSFKTDSNLFYLIMQYSNYMRDHNISKTVVDTVDYSPYISKLYSFVSADKKEFVILWVTDYEYFPSILTYYLVGDQLFKIGDLKISNPCLSSENFDYPIKSIIVNKLNDVIEFSFLKDVNLILNDTDSKLYKPGLLKFRYNITQKKLEIDR